MSLYYDGIPDLEVVIWVKIGVKFIKNTYLQRYWYCSVLLLFYFLLLNRNICVITEYVCSLPLFFIFVFIIGLVECCIASLLIRYDNYLFLLDASLSMLNKSAISIVRLEKLDITWLIYLI